MYKKIYKSMNLMSIFILALTAILILSACYSMFSTRIKDEIKRETVLMADLANDFGDTKNFLIKMQDSIKDKRITLVSPDGSVLYDNNVLIEGMQNHSDRPEIQDAKNHGIGEAQRHSTTLGTNVYYYAIRLNDGNVLRIAGITHNIFKIFMGILIPFLFILGLIYILSIVIAVNLTDNIVKPIENMDLTNDNYDDVYEELIPFLKRISGQNNEIIHQMERVKRQKLRIQAISENMNEGLILLDKNKNIISVNKSILNIFDAEESVVLNHNFMYLSRDVQFGEHLDRAFCGEKSTVTIGIKDKTYQIFYSPVFEKSQIIGVIMLMFDISDEVRASQIRKEFSANVSHELKTPLTTILGYSQIINNDIAKPEDIKGFTGKIEKEASRLIALIDDIIKLSSLDEQDVPMNMQKVNLLDIAKEVQQSLEEKAKKDDISINVEGIDTYVLGNLNQLTELVYNLCDNAIKYNKHRGTVNILVGEKNISVSDTGIGIPEEYKDRIFERFFRVDKSRSKRVNGTGLGLSIVKHIVMCHNAKIEVSSELDKGTTFKVIFNE